MLECLQRSRWRCQRQEASTQVSWSRSVCHPLPGQLLITAQVKFFFSFWFFWVLGSYPHVRGFSWLYIHGRLQETYGMPYGIKPCSAAWKANALLLDYGLGPKVSFSPQPKSITHPLLGQFITPPWSVSHPHCFPPGQFLTPSPGQFPTSPSQFLWPVSQSPTQVSFCLVNVSPQAQCSFSPRLDRFLSPSLVSFSPPPRSVFHFPPSFSS